MLTTSSAPCVCAVVVTYNPDLTVMRQLLMSIGPQVQAVILVDNGSSPACVSALRASTPGPGQLHFIALADNQGIAAAQNHGIRLGLALGCSHTLLLDHDSIPALDMVKQLWLLERRLLANDIKVGAVGPTLVDRRTFTRSGFVRKHRIFIRRCYPVKPAHCVESDFLISSGMLIRNVVLLDIGLMNGGYFIDHVDTEWCFRAAHRGYRLFGARRAVLNHTLGDTLVRVWFGRWREIPRHSPLRNYYIFRNTLHMVCRTPMSMAWRLVHLQRLVVFLTFFLFAGKPRLLRLRMMLRGILDGLNGVEGIMGASSMDRRK